MKTIPKWIVAHSISSVTSETPTANVEIATTRSGSDSGKKAIIFIFAVAIAVLD